MADWTAPATCVRCGSELFRVLADVSEKMLTQILRPLEAEGLLTRTIPTGPVTVTYELNYLGLSLHAMIRGIKRWAEDHMEDVLARCAVEPLPT